MLNSSRRTQHPGRGRFVDRSQYADTWDYNTLACVFGRGAGCSVGMVGVSGRSRCGVRPFPGAGKRPLFLEVSCSSEEERWVRSICQAWIRTLTASLELM